jgi:PRTRC genetic system ThiF family protein
MSRTFITPMNLIEDRFRIDLIGAGGTGSEVFDGLARMHQALTALGHPGFDVCLWDDDGVSETNVLRQRFLPGEVGANKAEVLVQKYNMFFGLDWKARPERYIARQGGRTDLLITCVDKAQVRAEIADEGCRCYSRTLWLDTGNGASDGQVVLGYLGSPDRGECHLPNVLDLYPEIASQAAELDNDGPSCSAEEALSRQEFPVNRLIATAACGLLWNMLRHGSIDHHGMFINTKTGAMSPLKIDPNVWAAFGYAPEGENSGEDDDDED